MALDGASPVSNTSFYAVCEAIPFQNEFQTAPLPNSGFSFILSGVAPLVVMRNIAQQAHQFRNLLFK